MCDFVCGTMMSHAKMSFSCTPDKDILDFTLG